MAARCFQLSSPVRLIRRTRYDDCTRPSTFAIIMCTVTAPSISEPGAYNIKMGPIVVGPDAYWQDISAVARVINKKPKYDRLQFIDYVSITFFFFAFYFIYRYFRLDFRVKRRCRHRMVFFFFITRVPVCHFSTKTGPARSNTRLDSKSKYLRPSETRRYKGGGLPGYASRSPPPLRRFWDVRTRRSVCELLGSSDRAVCSNRTGP